MHPLQAPPKCLKTQVFICAIASRLQEFVTRLSAVQIQPAPERSRVALRYLFLVMGLVSMAWVPRIPEIKIALGLSDGQLGLVLVSSSVGAVIGAQAAGHLVQLIGSKNLIRFLQVLMPAGVIVMGFADNVLLLVIGLFFMGMGYAGIDISANAQAVAVEKILSKRFLASLHGYWSIGAFSAALIGGIAANFSSPGLNLIAIGVIGAAAFIPLTEKLQGRGVDETGNENGDKSAKLPWFGKGVVVLWAMAIGATGSFIAEGAASDWGGVLLVEHLGTTPAISASAFATFSVAMIISRFTSDRVMHQFGLFHTVRFAGVVGGGIWAATILLAVPLSAISQLAAIVLVNVGFFIAGLAVGPMFPAFVLGASKISGVAPSLGIARIGVIAIAGYFVGPTITGLISELTSLPIAMLYPALALVLSGYLARALREPAKQTTH
jgi:fucose permease